MLGASYGTVEDIEVLWTLIALLGAGFSVYNLREARGDQAWLAEHNISNGRVYLAKITKWAESARLAKQMIFFAIGVLVMLLPTSDISQLTGTQIAVGVAIRWGLIVASALTTFQSILAFSARQHLKEE